MDLHIGFRCHAVSCHIQHPCLGAGRTEDILVAGLVDEPLVGDAVIIFVDLHIGAGFILGPVHVQQFAVLLVDDVIAAVILPDELPHLGSFRVVGIDDHVLVDEGQVHAAGCVDLCVEISAQIQGAVQIDVVIENLNIKSLTFSAGEIVDLHIGFRCHAVSGHIQHPGLGEGGAEYVLVAGLVDEPLVGDAVVIGIDLHIGAGFILGPVHIQQHLIFLVDNVVTAVALQRKPPDLGGCCTGIVNDDIGILQGQTHTAGKVDVCVEIGAELHGSIEVHNGGYGNQLEGLGIGAVIDIGADVGHGGSAVSGHVQNAGLGAGGTEYIAALRLIHEPPLGDVVMILENLHIGIGGALGPIGIQQ